ncbi:hypothetical protein [Methanococcus voltae]|uniref:Uncharacterized protein n=1 Tax=Methanococcus voltae (strain ATCC BAA-1334 / A3) TaxID=456320 RepID=D7DQP8_METV3|nr:hypothetical protein [Methanococcus voltae]MCS3900835.1 hypothetical protein [Methanococcus voltae]
MAKTNWNMWIIKMIATSLGAGAVFWYAGQHSIALNEIITTLASVPFLIILLIEGIDKFVDMKDVLTSLYQQSSGTTGYILVLAGAVLGFAGIVWALAGTLTLNVGSMNPAIIVVAGLLSLYILAPETGDDELILYIWLGATIATMAKYFILLPSIPGLPGLTT